MMHVLNRVLEEARKQLLNELSNKADSYTFWHTNTTVSDLRAIVDKIEALERELVK